MAMMFGAGACASAAAQTLAAPSTTGPVATATQQATVLPLEQARHIISPSGSATAQILARGDNAFVARLTMQPGAKVPEHADATEEYIHVLAGHGEIRIDGKSFSLQPGATVYMPANVRVSYINGIEVFEGIQIFSGPEPASKYEAWTDVESSK